jgi:hypothetical protein
METSDVLLGAMALIGKGYCTRTDARGPNGPCRVMDPEAHWWSPYGALLRATGGDDFQSQTSDIFEPVVMCLRDFS